MSHRRLFWVEGFPVTVNTVPCYEMRDSGCETAQIRHCTAASATFLLLKNELFAVYSLIIRESPMLHFRVNVPPIMALDSGAVSFSNGSFAA
jgi:hypothetical protein